MDEGRCVKTEKSGEKCGGNLVPVVSIEKDRSVVDYACEKCGKIGSLAQLILVRHKQASI
jgi:hypothetical protein